LSKIQNTMKTHIDYKAINKETWNQRTEVHFDSDFYDNKAFIAGRNSLNSIELDLLGDVTGKSILHLQCHFGQDTIQWTRQGCTPATGVDLSDKAIDRARELAKICNSNAEFVCSDIYELPQNHEGQYDIVFTSYGTIGWLPDINKWAEVVNHFLKPGGKFLIVDFHPALWMFDNDFTKVCHRYFNTEPIIEEEGTYTDGDEKLNAKCISWNHGLGEIIMSLINQGLHISSVTEYDYSPYDCFGDHTVKVAERKYRLKSMDDKLPMVYAIMAEKK